MALAYLDLIWYKEKNGLQAVEKVGQKAGWDFSFGRE